LNSNQTQKSHRGPAQSEQSFTPATVRPRTRRTPVSAPQRLVRFRGCVLELFV
jgi:hypothetical protein